MHHPRPPRRGGYPLLASTSLSALRSCLLPRMDSHHRHPAPEAGVLLLNYSAVSWGWLFQPAFPRDRSRTCTSLLLRQMPLLIGLHGVSYGGRRRACSPDLSWSLLFSRQRWLSRPVHLPYKTNADFRCDCWYARQELHLRC